MTDAFFGTERGIPKTEARKFGAFRFAPHPFCRELPRQSFTPPVRA